MDFWLNLRLRIRDFFTKYRLIIIIAIIVIAVIFTISFALKANNARRIARENSIKNVQTPIIDTNEKLPEGHNDKINELISNYFNYCNNKEYENAYVLLNEEFKSIYFKNIKNFKTYIDAVFATKRMYSIQNYSNLNNIYVYNVRIMDDILATGTTENYQYLEDKFVIKEENGELKLSLNGYCGQENLNIVAEDDYMKINIKSRRISYDKETYVVQYTNKTDNYIVLANGEETAEFCLEIQGQTRVADTKDSNIVILPKETTTKTISFDKYFDDEKTSTQFVLNAIRVLPEYSGKTEKLESEMKKAIKLYSRTINLVANEEQTEQ